MFGKCGFFREAGVGGMFLFFEDEFEQRGEKDAVIQSIAERLFLTFATIFVSVKK